MNLPHSEENEKAILGAIIQYENAQINGLPILKKEHFYNGQNAEICQVLQDMQAEGKSIDMITVTSEIKGKVQGANPMTVIELCEKVHSDAHIISWIGTLIKSYKERGLFAICMNYQKQALSGAYDPFKLIDGLQNELMELADLKGNSSIYHVSELVGLHIEKMERIASGDVEPFFKFNMRSYDDIQREQKGDLIITAARPAMGKTADMVNKAIQLAMQGMSVIIFSLEVPALHLMNRMIAAVGEIELNKILNSTMNLDEKHRYAEACNTISNLPIHIDDKPAITVMYARTQCRKIQIKQGLDYAFFDYLQLMSGSSKGNREQEISGISRNLKGLAKDLNIGVNALSQLSRAVETRGGDKRPQLSDLRESGAIEQDADSVVMLYRPEYYNITEYEDGTSTRNVLEKIVVKNRNGKTDTALQKINLSIQKISNLDNDFLDNERIEEVKENQINDWVIEPQTDIDSNLIF